MFIFLAIWFSLCLAGLFGWWLISGKIDEEQRLEGEDFKDSTTSVHLN
jgi:hypothetical protein